MSLNYRLILRITGIVAVILGISMVPSIIVSLIYREDNAALSFIATALPVSAAGLLLFIYSKPQSNIVRIRDGMLIVGMSWITATVLGALPYIISESVPNFANALFECASGFSTTGATILTDIESLPKSILFWRAFTHWLGGMGILIFAIALLPSLGIGGFRIAKSEYPGPTFDKLTPKISDSAKILYTLYIGMTAAETLLLLLGNMNIYDALTHSLSTVATGGFSNYSDSIAHFGSLYIELIVGLFMIMGGINFTLYYMMLSGKWKDFFKDEELRIYFFIIAAATVLILCILWFSHSQVSLCMGLRHSFFQVASAITTTGFTIVDYNVWPPAAKFILFTLMLTGGCSASTSGAVKVVRAIILFKLIKRGFHRRLHPNAVLPIKLGGRNVSSDTISGIVSFLFLYMMLFLAGTFIVSLENVDIITAAGSVAACLGNAGPGFELVGPMSNYSLYSGWTTIFLSVYMIAGRLELFTILLLLTPSFWNPDR